MQDILVRIKRYGLPRSYEKGDIIFAEGIKAEGFYFVEKGEVRAYKMDSEGREIEVSRFSQNNFFGEVILFASENFPVFTQALKKSDLLYFKRETVMQLIEKDRDVARFFLELLARKCMALNSQLESFTLKTVRQRLIQFLLSGCSKNENCIVSLSINKTELAKRIGTVSETLSRNLKQLQEEGLIEVMNKDIRIKNCIMLKKEIDPQDYPKRR